MSDRRAKASIPSWERESESLSEVMNGVDREVAKDILEKRPVRQEIQKTVSVIKPLVFQYRGIADGIINRHEREFSGFWDAFARLTTATETPTDRHLITWFLLQLEGAADVSAEDRQTILASKDSLVELFDTLATRK